jgi:mannan endo-1,4-beta-mannosidase
MTRSAALRSTLSLALPVLLACAGASNAPPSAPFPSDDDGEYGSGGELAVGPVRLDRIRHQGRDHYLSGFNIAWFDFARDVGRGVNEPRLRRAAGDLLSVGGNTMRWWIHTDGSTTPEWGTVGDERLVVGPGPSFIADMQRALDIAAEYEVFIVPSLWSFDMLRDNEQRRPPVQDNYRLLTDDAVLQSYLDAALTPMVEALSGHPALIAWELFNEPENMTESWFRSDQNFYGGSVPTLPQLQRAQGKMAAAIHRAAMDQGDTALVTTGSKSMGKYTSDAAGGTNLYRDDRLVAAADGDTLAVLDFYEPHYYDNEGDRGAWSVFHHPASHWEVDKPIVIGEFYTLEALDVLGEPVAPRQMCQRLVELGYAGGWPWQWNEYPTEIKACLSAMQAASDD